MTVRRPSQLSDDELLEWLRALVTEADRRGLEQPNTLLGVPGPPPIEHDCGS